MQKALYEMGNQLLGKKFMEAIGDNKVDNLVDEMKRSVEIEFGIFVCDLINSESPRFIQSIENPKNESFKRSLIALCERWKVMDDREQVDVVQKIEILWKDLVVRKYPELGAEVSELIAARYARQMVRYLKNKNTDPMAATDTLYPHDRDLAAKANPEKSQIFVTRSSQSVELADKGEIQQLDVLFNNPF